MCHHFSPDRGHLSRLRLSPGGVSSLTDEHLYHCPRSIQYLDVALTESMAPSSALPIGASRAVSELLPLHVDPSSFSSGLLNSVLALLVSTAGDGEQYDEELIDLPVQGFIIVYADDTFNLSSSAREQVLT